MISSVSAASAPSTAVPNGPYAAPVVPPGYADEFAYDQDYQSYAAMQQQSQFLPAPPPPHQKKFAPDIDARDVGGRAYSTEIALGLASVLMVTAAGVGSFVWQRGRQLNKERNNMAKKAAAQLQAQRMQVPHAGVPYADGVPAAPHGAAPDWKAPTSSLSVGSNLNKMGRSLSKASLSSLSPASSPGPSRNSSAANLAKAGSQATLPSPREGRAANVIHIDVPDRGIATGTVRSQTSADVAVETAKANWGPPRVKPVSPPQRDVPEEAVVDQGRWKATTQNLAGDYVAPHAAQPLPRRPSSPAMAIARPYHKAAHNSDGDSHASTPPSPGFFGARTPPTHEAPRPRMVDSDSDDASEHGDHADKAGSSPSKTNWFRVGR